MKEVHALNEALTQDCTPGAAFPDLTIARGVEGVEMDKKVVGDYLPIVSSDTRRQSPPVETDDSSAEADITAAPEHIGRAAVAAVAEPPDRQPDMKRVLPEAIGHAPAEAAGDRLELPENMAELMRTGLTPTTETGYGPFNIEGHPYLSVQPSEESSPERLTAILSAVTKLTEYGVHVPPSRPVECDGKLYVVTQHVEGISLFKKAAWANFTEETLSQVDTTWAGLSASLAECMHTGELMPDAADFVQYIYGTTAADPAKKIWLTSLSYKALDELQAPDCFENELLGLASTVVEIERLAGRQMEVARTSIRQAAELCRDSPTYGDGIQNAIDYALTHSKQIFPLTPRINQLRTR